MKLANVKICPANSIASRFGVDFLILYLRLREEHVIIARRQILADMGYEFTVMIADIDEKCIRKEKPEDLVMALAEAKADAIVSKLQTVNNQELDSEAIFLIAADTVEPIMQRLPIGDSVLEADPKLLITCDQVVVYEGVIREKPSCEEEAREFIKGYSGRNAATVSSVMITNLKTGIRKGQWDRVQDVWCGSENFQSHFPLIFTIVRDKSMLIENAYGVGTPSSWEVVVNRNLHDWRLVEYENLLQLLAGIRLSSVDDRSSWNLCKNSVFFVKSFYRSLVDSPVSCSGFTHKIFWHSLVRT
ncbi:uncharacterized protein LOC110817320 isoform X2 [Carica papaya]|uniref:uncharacterized protein LOC110817320 isoform X2 n=1 Tax=Carica papaya TaxID=3649 RepID=UPI000B8CAAE1|nr:uncharacterized protein LOC110817320 isoform X2 [Carica papaya]